MTLDEIVIDRPYSLVPAALIADSRIRSPKLLAAAIALAASNSLFTTIEDVSKLSRLREGAIDALEQLRNLGWADSGAEGWFLLEPTEVVEVSGEPEA